MVTPGPASIVVVDFPFSDLSGSKLRPAVVLCNTGRGDWLLCQITSNPHSDPDAVKITPADLAKGTLSSISFARPTKLFTANETLMVKRVAILKGASFGVAELLNLVQAKVSEYALDRILNGHHAKVGAVDAPTRYYILHRWAYGDEKIPFDDAMRLSMALGADVSTLMERRGILKQSGETVSLLGPKQRGKLDDLGLPDRTGKQADVIDVLQRGVSLWESGDRAGLARFLAEAAFGREDQVRLVAQTLVNVLPDDDSERRLLEGFLAGRELLAEQPRQERLL